MSCGGRGQGEGSSGPLYDRNDGEMGAIPEAQMHPLRPTSCAPPRPLPSQHRPRTRTRRGTRRCTRGRTRGCTRGCTRGWAAGGCRRGGQEGGAFLHPSRPPPDALPPWVGGDRNPAYVRVHDAGARVEPEAGGEDEGTDGDGTCEGAACSDLCVGKRGSVGVCGEWVCSFSPVADILCTPPTPGGHPPSRLTHSPLLRPPSPCSYSHPRRPPYSTWRPWRPL